MPTYFKKGAALQPTEITECPDVTLGEPEICKGGMFHSNYVAFSITTMPMEWAVKRRFEDFAWLRNVLATAHCDYIVPVLPKEVNQGALNQELPKRKLYL
jgi:hypothetical protein